MTHSALFCLSPLDGRYQRHMTQLSPLLSEYGLIYHRVLVEVRWLQCLAQCPDIAEVPALSQDAQHGLQALLDQFSVDDAQLIKDIEQTTNHDVKAVEYFLKQKFAADQHLTHVSEFLHFACTSEDINNLAYALMLTGAREQVLLPQIDQLLCQLAEMITDYNAVPMLARTHGQSATPTTMGKEFANVLYRLKRQRQSIAQVTILGKFNGAVGNFNAHHVAYPDLDWPALSRRFVESLGVTDNPLTTQIEPHDFIAELCHAMSRFNTILIDFCRDCWQYISLGYFSQKTIADEVGSSTMPHKVNPIDFENAEGNLGLANAIMSHLAGKLPISRMQRDLSDSTVLRNVGLGFGYTLLALKSLAKGLGKLLINEDFLAQELDQHWEVLAEAVQTVMRRYGIAEPYEQLKAFTRGKAMTMALMQSFIQELALPDHVKAGLLELSPPRYIGEAKKLAELAKNCYN